MTHYQVTLISLYWHKVIVPDDPDACWGWNGVIGHNGYPRLHIQVGGRQKAYVATRVSYLAHHGVWPAQLALHRCDNPPCTNPRHIYDGSAKQNALDREARGRGRRPTTVGKRHGMARLNEQLVQEIRERYARGGISQAALAREYRVGAQTIKDLIHRRYWKHVA